MPERLEISSYQRFLEALSLLFGVQLMWEG
jgi:hypothetical protein